MNDIVGIFMEYLFLEINYHGKYLRSKEEEEENQLRHFWMLRYVARGVLTMVGRLIVYLTLKYPDKPHAYISQGRSLADPSTNGSFFKNKRELNSFVAQNRSKFTSLGNN